MITSKISYYENIISMLDLKILLESAPLYLTTFQSNKKEKIVTQKQNQIKTKKKRKKKEKRETRRDL